MQKQTIFFITEQALYQFPDPRISILPYYAGLLPVLQKHRCVQEHTQTM